MAGAKIGQSSLRWELPITGGGLTKLLANHPNAPLAGSCSLPPAVHHGCPRLAEGSLLQSPAPSAQGRALTSSTSCWQRQWAAACVCKLGLAGGSGCSREREGSRR